MGPTLRIAIAGASGFIGRALVAHTAGAGHDVTAISRRGTGIADVREVQLASYATSHALSDALRDVDVLVHLAAKAHQAVHVTDADFGANLAVTQSLVDCARNTGVRRFLLVSSIGVNGARTGSRPFTESDAPAPIGPYACSKLRCEEWLQSSLANQAGPDWTIIRPPLVYGPGAPGNFARLMRAIGKGMPLPLASIRNKRSMVALDNLLDFILVCATHPRASRQVFLVADGEDVSTPDLLRRTAQAMGTTARLWPIPLPMLEVAAAIAGRRDQLLRLSGSLQIDIAKARTWLDWSPPIGVNEGLRRAAVSRGI